MGLNDAQVIAVEAIKQACFMCQTSTPVWKEESVDEYEHWHHEDFGQYCRANSLRNKLREMNLPQPTIVTKDESCPINLDWLDSWLDKVQELCICGEVGDVLYGLGEGNINLKEAKEAIRNLINNPRP